MTCNLLTNEQSLLSAFKSINDSKTGREWAIFEYDGSSNILKVGTEGDGGLKELLEHFDTAKIQYGFISVPIEENNQTAQRKIVLIHWQGEGVPAAKLASTASHVEQIRNFVRRVNLTISARNESDIEESFIIKELNKHLNIVLSFANDITSQNSDNHVPPVGTFYDKPDPSKDINKDDREKFWNELKNEEDSRRRGEIERKNKQQQQYQQEQKELEEKLHKKLVESLPPKSTTKIASTKKGNLIAGRTMLFEQKAAELARSAPKPSTKPKNFKYQVNMVDKGRAKEAKKLPEPPPKVFECTVRRKEVQVTSMAGDRASSKQNEVDNQNTTGNLSAPAHESVEKDFRGVSQNSIRSDESENLRNSETSSNDIEYDKPLIMMENKPLEGTGNFVPTSVQHNQPDFGIQAIALWDYQAEDANELTFDPDEVITNIQMVHDGWWHGHCNGQSGLFPSNYVKLIDH